MVIELRNQYRGISVRCKHVTIVVMAMLMACLFPATAQAQVVSQYTNTTDSTAGAINGTLPCTVGIAFQRDIFVADDFSVQDVNFGLLMAHTNRQDYGVFLRSPAGNIVNLKTTTATTADHLNVLFDDQAGSNISTHTANNDNATAATVVPPYQRTYRSTASMNATFFGQSSYGTWSLIICDFNNNAIDGTFYQADLYLTRPPASADLSMSKSVSSGSPSTAVYTLSVRNSAGSALTATGITVRDILPAGVTFAGASGTGTYNSGTGIWTPGVSIAPGQTVSINISVNITAASGTTITNVAEVWTSGTADPDSTPGNSVTTEDDYASRAFTVGGRVPGIAPSITGICAAAGVGTTLLDWNTQSWTPGSTTGTANVPNIGNVGFAINSQGTIDTPVALNTNNTGGLAPTEMSLFESIQYTNISQVTTTTVTVPVAVAGLQFSVFDVDYAVNDFADKLTVTGTYQGSPVSPTLTNNAANYISGNSAIGDLGSAGNSADGNVVVTFSAPVDTIVISYGNHTTAPADPDGQAISIHDFTFCRPQATLSATKISSVLSDGISASNPKAIPGATVQYCITLQNTGISAATNVSATDALPANTTYVPGTMASGANCGSATNIEDDNNSGPDETDPYGASVSGTTVTGTAATLGANATFAMIFNVTVN